MTTEHDLKTWPDYYARVIDGTKTFEVRRNDRGYQAGDLVTLREWQPAQLIKSIPYEAHYTGRQARYRIGYVYSTTPMHALGDLVVFSLIPLLGQPPEAPHAFVNPPIHWARAAGHEPCGHHDADQNYCRRRQHDRQHDPLHAPALRGGRRDGHGEET